FTIAQHDQCPISPVLCYGAEIGMGDDLHMPGRKAVRAPMQWHDGRNGGFSETAKSKLVQPVIENGPFGVDKVNVRAQDGEPGSLLELIRSLAAIRRAHNVLGEHECQI